MNAAEEERFNTHIFGVVETVVEGVQWQQAGDERKATGAKLGWLSINTQNGRWHQFSTGKGGYGSISILRHLKGYTRKQAEAWGDTFLKSHPGTGTGFVGGDTEIESALAAQEILDQLVEPGLTKAATYVRVERGIEITDFSNMPVRFLPYARVGESAIAGILTSHGRVVGVQIGYLNFHAGKSLVSPVRRRFALERCPDAIFDFPAPVNATDMLADTVIAEGLEAALAVVSLGRPWRVIGLPGIGAMRHQQVKPGERVLVLRDGDEPGSRADRALIEGVDHYILEGASVRISATPLDEDPDSILRASGPAGLMALIGTASDLAGLSRDGEIIRLSRLDPLDYESQRKLKAEELGIRVGALDEAVQRQRRTAGAATTPAADPPDGSGQGLELDDLVPWPDPVDGQVLLAELQATLRRYIVLGDHEAVVVVLWILGGHVFNEFFIFPRLFITAPEKGCGKTTLLDLLEMLVPRPVKVENITTAALFRTIEAARPSVLLDEADTFVSKHEELRGVIDSGHKRNGSVIRLVEIDGKLEPRKFSTWAPMALAAIKDLPGTIEDRSIRVKMKRRRADEPVQSLYRATGIDELARKLARWALDNADELSAADPEMPSGIINRTANNWQPLLAIAEAAGGTWPSRAREAAVALNSDTSADSTDIELLADIRGAFLTTPPVTVLTSDQLVTGLTLLEDRPWAEINNGRPLTKHGLARRLRPFRISPGTIWLGAGKTPQTGKGYKLEWFQDAFERYLPPLPPPPADSTVRSSGPAENKDFSADSKPSGKSDGINPDGLKNGENASVSAAPDDLTVANGGGTPGPEKEADPEPPPAANGDARPNGRDSGRKRRLSSIDREIVEYARANPSQSLDQLRKRFSARSKAEIAELLGRTP
jgi:putative DNA primase/helicase